MAEGERPDLEAAFDALTRSGELGPFRERVRRVEDYDRKHSSDLVRTLNAFFAANGNASEAADRLYLHRNSLPYRLSRVQGLTGLDLKDHRARLALQLGLLAIESESRDEVEHP